MRGYSVLLLLAVFLLCAAPAAAYQYVGGAENCQQCHSDYTSGSDWHSAHTQLAKDDCTKCHNEEQQVLTANCKKCHSQLPCKWVTQHTQQGTETCITCHTSCETQQETCPARSSLGPDNPRLETLRLFRDTVLAKSAAGRALIKAYYASAPALEAYLDAHPARKAFATRFVVWCAGMVEPFIEK